ncbi:basic blue -like [Olea europaea subsp. europaea]|uniref:Basic blue -like n=1 Tax=Olea europaea subsp. europaea TaxID=158383 RepID=A0A8S0TTE6_OLEEU|nr:basic blue -like [Olea europaea subsp. europaea]
MQISCRFLLVFILAAILIKKEAWGKQHVVGGSQGWDESTDYDSWAASQTFKVGDELVFKYTPGLHSVVELGSESSYKNCDISSALDSLNGGSNTVKLNKPGTRYFTCGTSGHCGQGMKLKITTVAGNGTATSTPASPSSTTSTSAAVPTNYESFGLFALVATLLVTSMIFNA